MADIVQAVEAHREDAAEEEDTELWIGPGHFYFVFLALLPICSWIRTLRD